MGLVLGVGACRSDQPQRLVKRQPVPGAGDVVIHEPAKLTSVPSGRVDALGREERVACVVCHSQRRPERLPSAMADLKEFHGGLRFEHGDLACGSCHVIGDQDRLRLADGSSVAMREALRLCGQCHGPQRRDYGQGAHGGMNGVWDLSQGDRVRNHCVDCHDPHVPRFQPSRPVLPPRDRYLNGRAS